MAEYCTADDLKLYADESNLRDLATDTGQALIGDLAESPVITELIKMASGRLEAACLVSENYSTTELTTMSDNSKALAREICARLVIVALMSRRIERYNAESVKAYRDDAENYLQLLRDGHRLFDVGKHAEAGKPELTYPSAQQIIDQNQITSRTRNFYPNPASRLPVSRQ